MGDLNWRAGISRGASSLAQSMRENAAYNRAMQQKEADRQYAEERYIMQANERERYRQDTEADRQAWRDEVDPLVEMPQGYTPEQWSAIADPVVQGPEGFQSASPTMQTEMARSSVAARMKPDQQKAQAESKYGPEAWDFYERQQRLLASLKEDAATLKAQREAGEDGLTDAQKLKKDTAFLAGVSDDFYGQYKLGTTNMGVYGGGHLSEAAQLDAGVLHGGGQYVEGIQMAVGPYLEEAYNMTNPDGSRMFGDTAEDKYEMSNLALAMLADRTPGVFPSTDFNTLEDSGGLPAGMGWDKYSGGRLIDDVGGWADHETSIADAKKAIADVYNKSGGSVLTYSSIKNGLKKIGVPEDKVTQLLSDLDKFDIKEYTKEAKKAEAVPEDLASKVEDELGYTPPSRYENGVWKFQLEDGSWNEWRD